MPRGATAFTWPELDLLKIVKEFRVPFVMNEPVRGTYVDDEGELQEYEYAPDVLVMRKLPIEADGPHHFRGKQPMKDAKRDRILKQRFGYPPLRITDMELKEDYDGCALKVRLAVRELLNVEFAKR